ncbi:hypothetical protein [Lacihabitans sp. CCS-44]|uniref:hypothetical protein n=1 Tax=Lacihabitans sp. CCS-44 TaxID=2487331 RepID=UPI0020CDCDCD|nr:hypothetical protein [Lacihabitans sp. CCS-44]
MGKTKQDRINTVYGGGGQVVILGAGASIASTRRNSEIGGKLLPSMDNFIELLGLNEIVESLPNHIQAKNFETLYSNLHNDNPNSGEILEIEKRVFDYFSQMELPNEPTIYDYLVLSLRPRDLIATFNWDPFLYQAYNRNCKIADMPHISFLHGNVAIGYSSVDKRCGASGMTSKETLNYYPPTKLLYPVHKKNYNDDEFTQTEWERVKYWLNHDSTKIVTIFGYGAPATDIEAVKLLNEAWGTSNQRAMEQFEIIDIRPEQEVRKQWDNFIHSHHYDYSTDYFNSSLARNPRRTFESYHQHILPMTPDEMFSASNPVPSTFKTMDELWDWHKDLVDAENEWKQKNPDFDADFK